MQFWQFLFLTLQEQNNQNPKLTGQLTTQSTTAPNISPSPPPRALFDFFGVA